MPGNEYAGGLIEHDGDVAKLLKALDDLGITDNTIVVYTTENGPNQFSWPDAATTPFAVKRILTGKAHFVYQPPFRPFRGRGRRRSSYRSISAPAGWERSRWLSNCPADLDPRWLRCCSSMT